MELSRACAKSVKDKDVEVMLSYRADDVILMSPNEAAIVGKDALKAMVEQSINTLGFEINWEPQKAQVPKCGEMGYGIFKNYMTMSIDTLENTRTVYNKGVEIWEKMPYGIWKNVI